jgi:hypothetical protein
MSARTLWTRRSLSRAGLLTATALTVLVVTFLVTTIIGLAVRSESPAVDETIAAGPIRTIGLSAETALSSNQRAQDAAARRVISSQLHGIDIDVARTVSTSPLALTAAMAKTAGVSSAVLMQDTPDVRANIRETAGSWPASTRGSVYPVAVQADAAKLLGVGVGDTFEIPSSDGALRLRVAATWRPSSAAAPLWFGDQQVVTGRSGDALGPLIVEPDALAKLDATPTVRWVVAPRAGSLTPGQLPQLVSGFSHLGAALGANDAASPTIVTITGDGTTTARGMQQSIASLGAVVSLPVALLGVGAVLALILLARLLAETRAAETTLLRARGATAGDLLRVTAVESTVIGVGGAVLGGAAATMLISIATGGLPATIVMIAPALLVALCLIVVQFVTVGSEVSGGLGVVRESGRARSVASIGLTVLVVIAAAFALWRFLQYRGANGAIDPAAVAAPALGILAAVMLGLTVFGPLAGLLDRGGSRSVGVAVTLPARQVGRGLGFFVAPVALLILAVGGTTLSSGYIGTWSALSSSSSRAVNAGDVRVTTGLASPIRTVADSVGAYTYSSINGVTAAIPAVHMSATLGSSTVPVVAAPVDRLNSVLSPDGNLLELPQIRAAIAPSKQQSSGVIALPRGAKSVAISLSTASSGDSSIPRTAGATVWVSDPSGELVPLSFASTPLLAHPDATWKVVVTVALPSGPGPWSVVAVDATVRGGIAGDDYSWKLAGLKATVESSTQTVQVTGVHGWNVASDAFPAHRAVRPLSTGIGFTASVLDATDGVTVRLMPGAERSPKVAVTSALAARNGLSVGDRVSLDGVWWATDARVGEIIPVVPGQRGAAVLFDLPSLQDQLLRTGAAPPATNEVWIAASDPVRILTRVQDIAGSTASVTIADTAFVDRFFGSAMLGLWLGCVGCVALAVIALAAATAALSRRRRAEVSVFRALGFSTAQQVRARSGELWVVGAVAVVIGLAAGALVTTLVAVALARLTVVTAPPAMSVTIALDLPAMIVCLAAMIAALLGVVFVYGRAIARQAADTEYREETR